SSCSVSPTCSACCFESLKRRTLHQYGGRGIAGGERLFLSGVRDDERRPLRLWHHPYKRELVRIVAGVLERSTEGRLKVNPTEAILLTGSTAIGDALVEPT